MKPIAKIVITKELATNRSVFTVRAFWFEAGVDHTNTDGISCGYNGSLASRLCDAINAGAVYKDPKIVKDIYGKTYVQATCALYTRHLNKSLRDIGF